MMYMPLDLELHAAHVQSERLREAAAERLASQVRKPPGLLRTVLLGVVSVALWLRR